MRAKTSRRTGPSVVIIDSQSVKIVSKRHKRHIAVDTMGLLLAVVAPLADIQDRVGAKALLIRLFMYFWCLKISQLGKQYKDYEISVASAEALHSAYAGFWNGFEDSL